MVAALFVDKTGTYSTFSKVQLWDQERDARLYREDFPVVCHPPCQLWGKFAKINFIRWGGEHNRPGNDGGCFASALANVRRCGGVLEHPASSYAWTAHGLTAPVKMGWNQIAHNEYVCEVWQSAYGHKARKRTWLFYVGNKPAELIWIRKNGTHQIGQHDQRGKNKNKPTLSGKAASATPKAFAKALIDLAIHSNL